MAAKTIRPGPRVTDRYFKLVRAFPLVPIADEPHLDAAQAVIDRLLETDLDAGGEAYLDALSALVERYEAEHHPVPDASEAEVLAFLLDQHGLTQAEFGRRAGIAKATVSDVLAGKRSLTRDQMTRAAAVFGLPPAVFLPAH